MSIDSQATTNTPADPHEGKLRALKGFRHFVARLHATPGEQPAWLKAIGDALDVLPQFRFVIDANFILGDLRYIVTKRTNPAMRTRLQELAGSDTVVPLVPQEVMAEVESHLQELADQMSVPVERFVAAWADYQKSLRPCRVSGETVVPETLLRDPTDAPAFLLASEAGAAAILTRDKDLLVTKQPTVSTEGLLIQLRTFTRAKQVELTISVCGVTVLTVGGASIYGTGWVVLQLAKALGRAPWWLQLIVGLGLGGGLAHPRSRGALIAWGKVLRESIQKTLKEMEPLLNRKLGEWEAAREAGSAAMEEVMRGLPNRPRVPLRAVAYGVCSAAGRPLTLEEIAVDVMAGGYRSKSDRFHVYLRRVLRQDPRFATDGSGRWAVSRARQQAANPLHQPVGRMMR